MKFFVLFLSSIAALALLLIGCGKDSDQIQGQSDSPVAVTQQTGGQGSTVDIKKGLKGLKTPNTCFTHLCGHIFLCDGTTPAVGVTVTLQGVNVSTTTDAGGQYCFYSNSQVGNLLCGQTYTVCVDVSTLPAANRTVILSRYASPLSTCQTVTGFDPGFDNIDWIFCGTSCSIHLDGHIWLCDRTVPAVGAKVTLQPGNVTTTTDNTGQYHFNGLNCPPPNGTPYTVCVDVTTLPAANRTVTYSNYANPLSSCQTLTVTGTTSDIDWIFCGPPPCSVIGSINSNFNGTAITGTGTNPGYLWFNSNFSVKGMTEGKKVTLTNSKVSINGTWYNVPDAVITFTNTVSCATTSFDGTKWVTSIPVAGSDEIFLSGLVLPLPNGLPGGAIVTWTGTFSTNQPGVCLQWKWGAAAYKPWPLTGGSPDYNAAQIKAAHQTCAYNNGDHAGTPENASVKKAVTGGARGGGGSNWTGSWSSTGSLCPVCP
jgi:hypothetical protein